MKEARSIHIKVFSGLSHILGRSRDPASQDDPVQKVYVAGVAKPVWLFDVLFGYRSFPYRFSAVRISSVEVNFTRGLPCGSPRAISNSLIRCQSEYVTTSGCRCLRNDSTAEG